MPTKSASLASYLTSTADRLTGTADVRWDREGVAEKIERTERNARADAPIVLAALLLGGEAEQAVASSRLAASMQAVRSSINPYDMAEAAVSGDISMFLPREHAKHLNSWACTWREPERRAESRCRATRVLSVLSKHDLIDLEDLASEVGIGYRDVAALIDDPDASDMDRADMHRLIKSARAHAEEEQAKRRETEPIQPKTIDVRRGSKKI